MGGPQGGQGGTVLRQTLASSLSLPRSSAWHFSKFFLKITEKMQNNFKCSNPKITWKNRHLGEKNHKLYWHFLEGGMHVCVCVCVCVSVCKRKVGENETDK